VIPELGAEDGLYAFRAEQARESTWKRIRQFLLNDDSITVEWDFGNVFFFLFSGLKEPGRQLRMFVCRREQGVGQHYVIFEIELGAVQDVDMRCAAEVAAATNGEAVSVDGFVTIRVSEHLTALTPRTFATSILRPVDAAEEYLAPPP
jgi:hypothetical protein